MGTSQIDAAVKRGAQEVLSYIFSWPFRKRLFFAMRLLMRKKKGVKK